MEGSVSRNEWDIKQSPYKDFPYKKGSVTLLTKVFQVIIQNIYGVLFSELQRTPLSLHLVILEKRSLTLCSKSFPTYHPIYLWVFIFESREKGVFFQKTGFWRTLLLIFIKCFSLHLSKRYLWDHVPKHFTTYQPIYLWGFIFRVAEKGYNTMQLYIYLLIRTRNPDLRSSCFV